ncbi:MAG: hypothetical protein NZP34_00400 [Caldilineales bacterium]|nr:hypothetical protein [Caldilineales bacterium]
MNPLQTMLDNAVEALPPQVLAAAAMLQRLAGKDKNGQWVLSPEQAINAALHQLGAGERLGEDFYVTDRGQIVSGYRGEMGKAARRGVGEYYYRFRAPTSQERRDHGLRDGDVAAVCELYQIELQQQLGDDYAPVMALAVVSEEEQYVTEAWDNEKRRLVPLPRERWTPRRPPTGRTWLWLAQIRALKAALRMAPGLLVAPETPRFSSLKTSRMGEIT